jgi:hypothetical protein
MKVPGIHNPFAKPELPKQQTSIGDDFLYSELRGQGPQAITLDGDSCLLRFNGATLDDIKDRLFALLYDVKNKYDSSLREHGVQVEEQLTPRKNTLSLKTKTGYISVYSKEMTEASAFRRIGYALSLLPIQDILKKHNVKIVERN